MKAKTLTISIILCLFVLFGAVSTIVYDKADSVAIQCYENSYAHTYAQQNKLDFELISDSDAYLGVLNLEDFSYNENGTITGYKGDSETIAIPEEINGIQMTRVAEYAFHYAKNLKKVYLPKCITTFNAKGLEHLTVYMYKDTALYQSLLNDKDTKVTIELIPDSYVINYNSDENPFSYDEISSQSLDITQYNGAETTVLIPESINGKIVTTLSLDVMGSGIKTLVIPQSVTNIQSKLSTPRYDLTYLVGMLIAFVGAAVAVAFVLTLKLDGNDAVLFRISQIRSAYVVAILSVILAAVYQFVDTVPDVAVFALLAVVYVLAIVSVAKAKVAVSVVEGQEQKVKVQTMFIKSLTVDAECLMNATKNPDVKAIAKKVYEAVRYSDPMSNAMLVEVEDKIQSSFVDFEAAVSGDDCELATSAAEELLNLVDIRNKKCKLLK